MRTFKVYVWQYKFWSSKHYICLARVLFIQFVRLMQSLLRQVKVSISVSDILHVHAVSRNGSCNISRAFIMGKNDKDKWTIQHQFSFHRLSNSDKICFQICHITSTHHLKLKKYTVLDLVVIYLLGQWQHSSLLLLLINSDR